MKSEIGSQRSLDIVLVPAGKTWAVYRRLFTRQIPLSIYYSPLFQLKYDLIGRHILLLCYPAPRSSHCFILYICLSVHACPFFFYYRWQSPCIYTTACTGTHLILVHSYHINLGLEKLDFHRQHQHNNRKRPKEESKELVSITYLQKTKLRPPSYPTNNGLSREQH